MFAHFGTELFVRSVSFNLSFFTKNTFFINPNKPALSLIEGQQTPPIDCNPLKFAILVLATNLSLQLNFDFPKQFDQILNFFVYLLPDC